MRIAHNNARSGRAAPVVVWLLVVLVLSGGTWLYFAICNAREAAIASGSKSPLNQLQLAFQNYHHTYGCFPPAYIADKAGKPIHSWRALILPYIDGGDLFKQYRFDEPWDGPNNRKLANRMPGMFCCPSEPPSNKLTNYVVIVGPETAFPGSKSTSHSDFEDGLDHTILLAEISKSTIEWLEPRDLNVDTMSFVINDPTKPSISTSRTQGPYIVFADRITTYTVTTALPVDVLRALTTIRGHEPIFMANVGGKIRGLMSPHVGGANDDDLIRFTDWDKARSVWLNRSRITDEGLAQFGNASQLAHVHLAHTPITNEGLRHLARLKDLYALDLAHTAITDVELAHLTGLGDIYYLDLTGTQVTIAGVAKLLRSLPKVQITFALGKVGHELLDLSRSSAGDGDLEHFQGLTELNNADLSRTDIGDPGLVTVQTWSGLQSLDVSNTVITDRGLEKLQSLSQLTNLKVTTTNVTKTGLANLKRALPHLHIEN